MIQEIRLIPELEVESFFESARTEKSKVNLKAVDTLGLDVRMCVLSRKLTVEKILLSHYPKISKSKEVLFSSTMNLLKTF